MANSLDSNDFIELLARIADDMQAKKEFLCGLDGAVGDGDLGVTAAVGFNAVKLASKSLTGKDIGTILTQSALTLNDAAGATFGILMASAMTAAGREAANKISLDLGDLVRMADSAAAAIRNRGKADVGDKTMLDAIIPAIEALRTSHTKGNSISQALHSSLRAARDAAEATRSLRAKVGRSRWLGDRTIGAADAGAVAICMILESCANYASERSL